jgi:hypothetical protein
MMNGLFISLFESKRTKKKSKNVAGSTISLYSGKKQNLIL